MNDYLRNDDEIIFRTEDLKQREIQDKFVETGKDRENIEYLKKKTPIILWEHPKVCVNLQTDVR